MSDPPWALPSRSVQGRKTERQLAKKHGAKAHPNSGAGSIKDDASDAENLYEYKDANKSHTLIGRDMNALLRRALAQGREARYVVYFRAFNFTADITLRRGKG